MADILPRNGLQSRVALGYHDRNGSDGGGEDMDLEERMRLAEMAIQRQSDRIDGHERECGLRYREIVAGVGRIEGYLKYLAMSVAALALVVLGVATVQDLVRSGAARAGVVVQAPPNPPR